MSENVHMSTEKPEVMDLLLRVSAVAVAAGEE